MKEREYELNPGQELQAFLEELYPQDPPKQEAFAYKLDGLFGEDGELAHLMYKSAINYAVRRLITAAAFLDRKYKNQPNTKFFVKLREYLKDNLRLLKDRDREKIHALLRQCIEAKNREVKPKRKQSIRRQAIDQNLNCYICGCEIDFESSCQYNSPEIEHLWPQNLGGWSDYVNLKIACHQCNQNKKDYIDFSDFHYEEISLVSNNNEDSFMKEMNRLYRIALWSKNEYKCVICDRPASQVGELKLYRDDPDDTWHFLNISAYCEKHYPG
ncbi:HNH endonuclease [Baaleninema simplex]|uniref:HNH endonuclease n=1 Tax=Baaleninema simplex TaxID=2862350 RepID=UPI000349A7BC|nr:HNH endonuclease [Baaleninema simplex]